MRTSIRVWAAGLAVMAAAAYLPRGAAGEDEKPPVPAVESKIDRVLLYSDRALVIRLGKVQVPAGRSKVAFEGLPGKLADYSVAAALKGNGAQIANIEIEPVYKTTFRSKEAEEAARDLKALERDMRALQDQRAAVIGEMNFTSTLRIGARPPAGQEAKPVPLAPESWATVLDFMGKTLRDDAQRARDIEEKMDDLRSKIIVASARARLLLSYKNELTKRVILELAADKAGERGIEVSYIVPDAAWFPRYDVRADMADGKIEVVSYGLVRQESGEDWTDAQLSFSAAEPATAANLPELSSWRIAAAQPAQVAAAIVSRSLNLSSVYYYDSKTNFRDVQSRTQYEGTLALRAMAANMGPANWDEFSGVVKDLDASVQQAQAAAQPNAPASLPRGGEVPGQRLTGLAGDMPQSHRLQEEIAEIEQLNVKQQEARARKDWAGFAGSNGMITEKIGRLDIAQQKMLAGYVVNATNNMDVANRWLESQKLENGLIAPVQSSGGYDYRWQALRRESVPSDGALTKTVIFRQEFPAEFVYELAAQKSKMAFLRTKLANSTRSPFLAGPVSVFLASDFVGESSLKTTAPSEEFTIGLGADEGISVDRRLEVKRDTHGFLSTDYRFNATVTVTVRNGKAKPAAVAVLERMPVTWDKKLTISEGQFEPEPALKEAHQEKTTFVRWEKTLAPGEKQEFKMSYYYQHAADLRMVANEDPSVKW